MNRQALKNTVKDVLRVVFYLSTLIGIIILVSFSPEWLVVTIACILVIIFVAIIIIGVYYEHLDKIEEEEWEEEHRKDNW